MTESSAFSITSVDPSTTKACLSLVTALLEEEHQDGGFLNPDGSTTTLTQWQQRVNAWRHSLQQNPAQRWALYTQDPYNFSSCLFALIAEGRQIILPGHIQPSLIEALQSDVDGWLCDRAINASNYLCSEQAFSDQFTQSPLVTENIHQAKIIIYTSGSSGEPQQIEKNVQQLFSEVAHLQQLIAENFCTDTLNQALVLATVSHQHIYGLLFKILLPLCSNWHIDRQQCEYLESLEQRFHHRQAARILISSPTHLSRLPSLTAMASSQLPLVFSSGAPLSLQHSQQCAIALSTDIVEIYGSSETGGIAWRQQHRQDRQDWHPLPGVQCRQHLDTECLEVCSSHLPASTAWFLTADRITMLQSGCFKLLGRIDRIVKLEGKRLSLNEMEQFLLQSGLVSQARLLMIEKTRLQLAAAVVLNQHGQQLLQQRGKNHVTQALKKHLSQKFERPTLPKRWRFESALPFNQQGKLTQASLLALFEPQAKS